MIGRVPSLPATVPARPAKRPNLDGGRPTSPLNVVRESLVEALVAIDCEREFLEHYAGAAAALSRALVERALRLKRVVRPEIALGYDVAETALSLEAVAA